MRILVVEDEPKVAFFIKKGLEEEGYEVDHVEDGLEGRNKALEEQYDLVLMDVMLPGMSGVEACRQIRAADPTTPILMLTALGTTPDKISGLDAGADDYLTKPFSFAELLARIRALVRRGSFGHVQDLMLTAGDLEMNCNTKTVMRNDRIILLTTKEYALLEYFLKNKNKVVTRHDLARDVWNIAFETGTNFIDVYVNYLRNKIDKPFSKKLLQTIIGMGYMLKDDAS